MKEFILNTLHIICTYKYITFSSNKIFYCLNDFNSEKRHIAEKITEKVNYTLGKCPRIRDTR